MSSKISGERLAEILGSDMAVGTSEQVGALIWKLAREVSEHRAREAAMREEWGLKAPSHDYPRATGYESRAEAEAWRGIPGGLAGDHVVRRLVGPWEPVTEGEDDG